MSKDEKKRLEFLVYDMDSKLHSGFFTAAQQVVIEIYRLKILDVLGKKNELWLQFL